MKTYDISDRNALRLRHLVANSTFPEDTKESMLADLDPICDMDERIVTTVGTFRDFHDTSDAETQEVLDNMSDEELEQWVPDLYDDWASRCNTAAEELVYAARKKKA